MADDQTAPTIIRRRVALKAGLKRYYTGKPCKHGHIDERFVSSRKCLTCHASFGAATFKKRFDSDPDYRQRHNAVAIEWKKNNPERATEHGRHWRKANLEKSRELCREWHRANPEKVKASAKAWVAANRAKVRANFNRWSDANRERVRALQKAWNEAHPEELKFMRRLGRIARREREARNGGKCTREGLLSVFERCGGRCVVCGTADNIEVDHIMPVRRGGTNNPDNLQLLCHDHNMEKRDRHPIEWAESLGLDPKVLWPHLSLTMESTDAP